jgi:hypothetical protein
VFAGRWDIETFAPAKTDVQSLLLLAGNTPAPVCAEPAALRDSPLVICGLPWYAGLADKSFLDDR